MKGKVLSMARADPSCYVQFKTCKRWREEVPKILIFITDGRPQDRALVPRYAQSLRDKKIRIFAIGVGEATEEELKEIASKPHEDHVIFISGGKLRRFISYKL